MRVIAGTAKGLKLEAPKGDRVRPALDKVKGAIFNILFDVTGLSVLDLFAGTGAVGIEALSRGASVAVFVEAWKPAALTIRKNLEHCKLNDKARIIEDRVSSAIRRLNKNAKCFDLVFVDPPYLKNFVNSTLTQLSKSRILGENSQIIVEHHPKEPIKDIEGLVLTDSRKYGQTLIDFVRRTLVS